jgi:hypothetical protein
MTVRQNEESMSDRESMAVDALVRAVDALILLKALIKTPDEPLTDSQRAGVVHVVNDGYDHAVATLLALGVPDADEQRLSDG